MQGQIIHYDDLTRCGLLRNEAGEAVFFRREQVAGTDPVLDRQWVSLVQSAEGVLTILRLAEQPQLSATTTPQATTNNLEYSVLSDWPNWLGGLTAGVAALVLWLAGRDVTWVSYEKTPSLTNSWWGIFTGCLLVYQVVNYIASAPARNLQSTAWLLLFCSLGFQSCNDFTTKTMIEWYDILLITTLIMAYILPLFKRS